MHHHHHHHQQQQSPQMFNIAPSHPTINITTEQIQKYLNENKQLILAIMENQNLGKLNDCAQYQAQLQKNLMYLAAIADAQPQPPTAPSQAQMSAQPTIAQELFMQHPQPGITQQQTGAFGSGRPDDHHRLTQVVQQQQSMEGVMGTKVGGVNLATRSRLGTPGPGHGPGPTHLMTDARRKQDGSGSEAGYGDGQGKSSGQNGK